MADHITVDAELRDMATANEIFRCQAGSGVHGTAIGGTDDRDEMGICIEPERYVIGLRKFEQYEHHTAWDRPGGRANRSRAGDLDLNIYSLRKWLRLALKGNPSILVPLFVPDAETVVTSATWRHLRAYRNRVISKEAGHRFLGYLESQRAGMLGKRTKNVTRPELIEAHGFDTKFAAHAVRLGYQGLELMRTGNITLPMPEAEREVVREIRQGKHSLGTCTDLVQRLEDVTRMAMEKSELPEHSDHAWADEFLTWAYKAHWNERRRDERWAYER